MAVRAFIKSCSNCDYFTWKRRSKGGWSFCLKANRHLPGRPDLTTKVCRTWKEKEYN